MRLPFIIGSSDFVCGDFICMYWENGSNVFNYFG